MVRNGFTRKKVGSLTLGEKLKKIRSDYRIGLNEVSRHTKIQLKYLEYLESGEYEKLPPDVYVRGFVRSYAHFLGADEQVLVRLYERERNIRKNLKKEQFEEGRMRQFSIPNFVVTPKVLAGSMAFLLVFAGFWYLYREFRSFAAAPYLVVLEPADGQVVENGETYVRGRTDKDVRLSINGQPTLVRDDGSFLERVSLQPGPNTLTIAALNKFDKEERRAVTIQARYEALPSVPTTTDASVGQPSDQGLALEVSVLGQPTRISVQTDGTVVYNGVMVPGDRQSFEAEETIRIGSEDGGRTMVRLNGGEEKRLGQDGDPVKETTFSIEDIRTGGPMD
jgi:hypothetical protein